MNSIINHLGGANGLKLIYEEYMPADENLNRTWTFDVMPKFMVLSSEWHYGQQHESSMGSMDLSLYSVRTGDVYPYAIVAQFRQMNTSFTIPSYKIIPENKQIIQSWVSSMPDNNHIAFYA